MKVSGYAMIAAVAVVGAAVPAHAVNIVTNGGFEAPVIGSSFVPVASPSAAITGWNVTAGSVDLVRSPTYVVNSGAQALDLFGVNNGTLTQLLNTVVGQVYSITFAFSHNNLSPSSFVYSANVSAGDLSQSFSHTGTTTPFTTFTGFFTASSTSTLLTFASLAGTNNGGIFLDDINVQAVPEPATWAMLILGFGMVGGAMRYGRRSTSVTFASA